MTIKLQVLREPLLEFGRGECGVDPRLMMRKSGALMAAPDRIEIHQLGLVCPAEEVQAIKTWFSVMRGLVMGDEANASRFSAFPGTEKAFGCVYEIPDQFIRTIDQREFALQQSKHPAERFEGLLDLYAGKIESMFDDVRPKVVLVAFRESEADLRVTNSKLSPEERQALEYLQREDDKQTELFAPDRMRLSGLQN